MKLIKISTSSIDVVKPRTTRSKENIGVPVRIGNNVQVENVYGSPTLGMSYFVELRDQRLPATGFPTSGDQIGNARVYDFNQKLSQVWEHLDMI